MKPEAQQLIYSPGSDQRLFVILGAFGSGKTEFAINLARALRAQGRQVDLADLDLVNPYFRSREKDSLLEALGIRMVAPEGELRHADLPSIPPQLFAAISDKGRATVLDVGGDRHGARILASFSQALNKAAPSVYYVLNRSRHENRTLESALSTLSQIGAASGLSLNGLVHNTHLMAHTRAEDILAGAAFAKQVSEQSGLPIICHCYQEGFKEDLGTLSPLFPLSLHMNRPWE